MKILVVDSNDIISQICSYVFDKLGHEVEIVTTGQAALQQIVAKKYDLIFLDLFLKDMSGLLILQELRGRDITSIIVTEHYSSELVKKAVELDATYLLFKPFDPNNLEIILTLAQKRHSMDRARETTKQKLIEEQEKYKIVVDRITEGVIIIKDQIVRYVNKTFCHWINESYLNLIGKEMSIFNKYLLIDEDFYTKMKNNNIEQYINQLAVIKLINKKTAKVMLTEIFIDKINYENGAAYLILFKDLTNNLPEKNQPLLQEQSLSLPIIHYTALLDRDLSLKNINEEVEKITKFKKTECYQIAGFLLKLIYPDDLNYFIENLRIIIKNKNQGSIKYRLIDKNGNIHQVINVIKPLSVNNFDKIEQITGAIIEI